MSCRDWCSVTRETPSEFPPDANPTVDEVLAAYRDEDSQVTGFRCSSYLILVEERPQREEPYEWYFDPESGGLIGMYLDAGREQDVPFACGYRYWGDVWGRCEDLCEVDLDDPDFGCLDG